MNFVPHSSNFSSVPPQSQAQSMNTFNNGLPYNFGNSFTGYPYPFSYQQFQPQHNGHFNPTNYHKETPVITKRECTPLIVIDPQKNEVINLEEISKSTKINSSHNEIENRPLQAKVSISLNTVYPLYQKRNESPDHDIIGLSHEDDLKSSDQDEGDQTGLDEQDKNQSTKEEECEETGEEFSGVSDDNNDDDKSDMVSSTFEEPDGKNDTGLSTKSNNTIAMSNTDMTDQTAFDLVQEDNETGSDKNRLIYHRGTLLEISRSSLCRKPILDCLEIYEDRGSKNYDQAMQYNKTSDSLKRSATAYVMPSLRLKVECSLNEQLATSRRYFKCILNKIVPQNFDECVKEIIKLITGSDDKDFRAEDFMDCLIEEIFDKAVQEQAYSVTYANLCSRIINHEEKNDLKLLFKASLLNRCRNMFETPLQNQLASVRTYWEKRTEDEKDAKLKILYGSDIEEQVKKAKDKYFGNIRFIGELYMHDLLSPSLIDRCVTELMAKRTEEDAMISLCKLLETCGKKFGDLFYKKMEAYISDITKIAEEETNTRIKFRLYDLIEMSARNWSLRKVQAEKMIQPTTLDQVKKLDIDEKVIEASKLSNRTQMRMNKKVNNIFNAELKLKTVQNKNQSLDINSLQMPTNDTIELKPSYGMWKFGSGVNDDEWQSVESKRGGRYGKGSNKQKSYQITSRDDSPSKVDSGGRFALLRQSDIDDNNEDKSDTMTSEQGTHDFMTDDRTTSELSQVNTLVNETAILDADGIYRHLLDTGSFDTDSWSKLSDRSKVVAQWVDQIMEKNRDIRNMFGTELAQLLSSGLLSIGDLTKGINDFSDEIEDLRTDIPLIWNFFAEFLERFIVSPESDISFFANLFVPQCSKTDIVNCIATSLKFANGRLGCDTIRKVMNKCTWSFHDFMGDESVDEFLSSKDLNFLFENPLDQSSFSPFKDDLISLLPNDDEEIHKFLNKNFDLEVLHSAECVYFVSSCVFSYISNLLLEGVTDFLLKKKLFFLWLLDRRPELEYQTLQALKDSVTLFKEKGLLVTVVYGLGDNILSFEAFKQFIERVGAGGNASTDMLESVIRSMLEDRRQ